MSEEPRPEHRRWILAAAAVAAWSAAPYLNALGNGFINWDDPIIILGQPFLRELTPANLWRIASPWPAREEWLPLRDLSLALNFALGGEQPFGFIAGNILLHAAASVAVLFLLRRLGLGIAASFLGGLLFACHAIHVESVTWLSARKDPLSTLLMVTALSTWIAWRAGERGRRAYFGALGLFALSLLAKANAFVFPAWLLLYDLCFLRGVSLRARFAPLAPFALLGIGHLLLYLRLTSLDGVIEPYPEGGLSSVLLTDLALVADYLRDLVLPLRHQAIYEVEFLRSLWSPRLLAGAAAVAALAVIAWCGRRRPWLPFAVGFFFVNLLPYLNLVPHGIYYAERYLYLPSISYALALGAGAAWLAARVRGSRTARAALVAIGALYFAAHLGASWTRNEVWAESRGFWRHQAAQLPGNPTPALNLGETLELEGDDAAAAAIYRQLLAPERRRVPEATFRLARVLRRGGDLRGAAALYENYCRAAPGDPRGWNNLAETHLALQESGAALAIWERLCREQPRYLLARANLARCLLSLGRAEESRPHWEHILNHAELLTQEALVREARSQLAQWRPPASER